MISMFKAFWCACVYVWGSGVHTENHSMPIRVTPYQLVLCITMPEVNFEKISFECTWPGEQCILPIHLMLSLTLGEKTDKTTNYIRARNGREVFRTFIPLQVKQVGR